MPRAEPFLARAQMRLLVPSIGVLVLSLTTVAASGSPLNEAQQIDCNAINRGTLNVELAGTARTTRVAVLKAGETLNFAFETVAGPFGSLTLVAGAGSPRPLLAGPTGTTVEFVAPARGTFGFDFAAEGEEDAAFTVTCSPARSARQDQNQNGSSVSRFAKLLAETPDAWVLPEPEIPDSIDPDTWGLMQDGQPTGHTVPGAQGKPATGSSRIVRPPDGLDVWLQGKDGRHSLSAQGTPPQVGDAAAVSGGGVNYKLLPQIMVGALVQFDQQSQHGIMGPRSLSEQGWMAGPATTVQLAPGISLDARAAWGESKPATSYPAATGPGADRRLVNARLANTQTLGHWRFSSSVAVDYSEATQHFADPPTDGGLAPRTVGSGRVNIRPELGYRLDLDGSTFIEPKAAISSFWDIDSLSRLAPGSSGHEDMRLKAEAGVTLGMTTGTRLQATGGVEGGSAGAADIWSGRFQLSVPLK